MSGRRVWGALVVGLVVAVVGCGSIPQLTPTPIELPQGCHTEADCRPTPIDTCLAVRCHLLPEVPIGYCEYLPYTNGADCK